MWFCVLYNFAHHSQNPFYHITLLLTYSLHNNNKIPTAVHWLHFVILCLGAVTVFYSRFLFLPSDSTGHPPALPHFISLRLAAAAVHNIHTIKPSVAATSHGNTISGVSLLPRRQNHENQRRIIPWLGPSTLYLSLGSAFWSGLVYLVAEKLTTTAASRQGQFMTSLHNRVILAPLACAT